LETPLPQAWQNDFAVEVDAEGPTVWDVTDEVLAMGKENALKLGDDRHLSDNLRFSPTAPKWIQDWSGPFYVRVEEAIRDYFAQERN
jgi:hypothetical protein